MYLGDDKAGSLRERMAQLRQEHRDLDAAIERLQEGPYVDQLQIRRLKRRRLLLRDALQRFESGLIPDLDA